MGGPMRYEFDPAEMTGYAGTLSRAGSELSDAANRLKSAVGGAGDLPPGVLAAVQSEVSSAGRLLSAAADVYEAAARDVRRAAAAARRAGQDEGWFPSAGSTITKIVKHGSAVLVEIDKHVNGGNVKRTARRRIALNALGDLTGLKGLQVAAKYAEWQKAYREARMRSGDSPVTRLRKTFEQRVRNQQRANPNGDLYKGGADPGRRVGPRGPAAANRGLRRMLRVGAGAAPGVGVSVDAAGMASDISELRKKDNLRNRLAVAASSLHVASDGAQAAIFSPAAPVAAVAAGATEAVGTAADVGVLVIDTAPIIKDAAKGAADRAVEHVPAVRVGAKGVGLVRDLFGGKD